MNNKRFISVFTAMVFIAALLSFFFPAGAHTADGSALHGSLVSAGDRYYEKGEYRTAVKLYLAAGKRRGGDDISFETSFRWADSLFSLGEYKAAADKFSDLLGKMPAGDLDTGLIRLFLGYSLARLGRTGKALTVARDFYDEEGHKPVEVRIGLALFEKLARGGDSKGAVRVLDKLYREIETDDVRRTVVSKLIDLTESQSGDPLVNIMKETMITRPSEGVLLPWLRELMARGRTAQLRDMVAVLEKESDDPDLREGIHVLQNRVQKLRDSGDLRIGVLVPLSGDYRFFGQKILQAFELAAEKYNDPGISLVVRDTMSDPGRGRLAAIELIESKGVVAILGPVLSSVAEEVAAIADERKIPVFSPSAQMPGLPSLSPYFFRNCFTLKQQAEMMARAAVGGMNVTKFAILAPSDNYGKTLSRAFWDEVLALNGEVLYFAEYGLDQTDFSREIKLVREEDEEVEEVIEEEEIEEGQEEEEKEEEEKDYKPPYGAIYIPDTYNRVGLIAPQLSFHDLDQDEIVILGSSGLNTPDFIRIGEEYVENTIFLDGFFAGSQTIEARDFTSRYRKKYKEDPYLLAAQAYDAADIILSIIRDGATSSDEIRYKLAFLKDFPGVCGLTGMDADGDSIREPVFITVFNGRFVELEFEGPK